jgi:hypothetical protein
MGLAGLTTYDNFNKSNVPHKLKNEFNICRLNRKTPKNTANIWSTETNFMAAQSASVFTNFFTNGAQKFYRIVGY